MLDTAFLIRLTKEQREQLKALAREDGRSAGSWVRRQVELAYRVKAQHEQQQQAG